MLKKCCRAYEALQIDLAFWYKFWWVCWKCYKAKIRYLEMKVSTNRCCVHWVEEAEEIFVLLALITLERCVGKNLQGNSHSPSRLSSASIFTISISMKFLLISNLLFCRERLRQLLPHMDIVNNVIVLFVRVFHFLRSCYPLSPQYSVFQYINHRL